MVPCSWDICDIINWFGKHELVLFISVPSQSMWKEAKLTELKVRGKGKSSLKLTWKQIGVNGFKFCINQILYCCSFRIIYIATLVTRKETKFNNCYLDNKCYTTETSVCIMGSEDLNNKMGGRDLGTKMLTNGTLQSIIHSPAHESLEL